MTNFKNLSRGFISCALLMLQVSVAFGKGDTRIVGGIAANIEKAPFLVQIHKDGSFQCGGTLVSDKFVVTAAHCFKNLGTSRLVVIGGASRRTDFGIRSGVSKIILPSDYNAVTLHMDVAVIKLNRRLQGPSIKPINLCQNAIRKGDPVQLFGWGSQEENDYLLPNQLQTVDVKVVDRNLCAEQFHFVTDSMFCASALGRDACSGDSGGPAIVNGEFCGIVSWGYGCARYGYPGVYTDVLNVQEFIRSAMQK